MYISLFIYCEYCYYEHRCINTCLISSWLSILLVIYLGVELLDPIFVSLFEKLPNYIPQQLLSFYIPTSHAQGFQFLHSLKNTLLPLAVFITAILMDVKWFFIVVLICFPWWLMMLRIFSCAYLPWNIFFGEMLFHFIAEL